jgi:hypothetical protein
VKEILMVVNIFMVCFLYYYADFKTDPEKRWCVKRKEIAAVCVIVGLILAISCNGWIVLLILLLAWYCLRIGNRSD